MPTHGEKGRGVMGWVHDKHEAHKARAVMKELDALLGTTGDDSADEVRVAKEWLEGKVRQVEQELVYGSVPEGSSVLSGAEHVEDAIVEHVEMYGHEYVQTLRKKIDDTLREVTQERSALEEKHAKSVVGDYNLFCIRLRGWLDILTKAEVERGLDIDRTTPRAADVPPPSKEKVLPGGKLGDVEQSPFFDVLRTMEANASSYERIQCLVESRFKKLVASEGMGAKERRALQRELVQVRDEMQKVQEVVSMATNEQIAGWSSDLLDAMQRGHEGLVTLKASNPFARLLVLDAAPRVSAALRAMFKEIGEEVVRVAPVGAFKNLRTEAQMMGAFAFFGAWTWFSFLMSGTGLQNFLMAGTQMVGGGSAVAKYATYLQAGGYALSGAITYRYARDRGLPKDRRSKWFWPALGAAAAFGFMGVVEKIDESGGLVKYSKDLGDVGAKWLTQIDQIDPALERAEVKFITEVVKAAKTESANGFGPKTMLTLSALLSLDPAYVETLKKNEKVWKQLPQDVQQFLSQNFEQQYTAWLAKINSKDRFSAEWTKYQQAISEIAAKPEYAALGFGADMHGAKVLQVLAAKFAHVRAKPSDGVDALVALVQLDKKRHNAEEGTMWDHLVGTLHLPKVILDELAHFGIKDVPSFLMFLGEKQRIATLAKQPLERYGAVRTKDAHLAKKFLQDLAAKTGYAKLGELTRLLDLEAVKITPADIDAVAAGITDPQVRLGLQILLSQSGWEAMNTALNKGGIKIDLMNEGQLQAMGIDVNLPWWAKRLLVALTIAFGYGLFDKSPGFVIHTMNSVRARRFDRLVARGYEQINENEHQLADILVRRMRDMDALSKNVIDMSQGGLALRLPYEVQVALVRRKLRDMSERAYMEHYTAHGVTPAATAYGRVWNDFKAGRRDAGLLTLLNTAREGVRDTAGYFLGFETTPESVGVFNAHAKWLNEKVIAATKGDEKVVLELLAGISPKIMTVGSALLSTLEEKKGTPAHEQALAEVLGGVSTLRQDEIAAAVPELREQLAQLDQMYDALMEKYPNDEYERVILGGSLTGKYADDFVTKQYVIAEIRNERLRYRALLSEMKDAAALLQKTTGSSIDEHVFTAPLPTPEAASQDTLIRLAHQRVRGYEGMIASPTYDGKETAIYMQVLANELLTPRDDKGRRVQGVLERLHDQIETVESIGTDGIPRDKSFVPVLRGRRLSLSHAYDELTGMMTISLDTVEPYDPKNPAEQDVISVPFTKYSIPDFHTGKSAVEIVQDLRAWLAPNGEAHRLLHAQVLHKQMQDRYTQEVLDLQEAFGAYEGAEAAALEAAVENRPQKERQPDLAREMDVVRGGSGDVRITQEALDEILAEQFGTLSPTVHSLARIQYLKTWLAERDTMLKHVAAGGDISQDDLAWLSSRRLAESKDFDAAVLRATINEVQSALGPVAQALQAGDIPRGAHLSIDPKEDGPLEFVAARGGVVIRVPLATVPLELSRIVTSLKGAAETEGAR